MHEVCVSTPASRARYLQATHLGVAGLVLVLVCIVLRIVSWHIHLQMWAS